jgi:hypothetical protein
MRVTLVIGTALCFAACQDQPTAPIVDQGADNPVEFVLTPEGATAAEAATMLGAHQLRTVSTRTVPGASFSPGPTTNSPFDLTFGGGPVLTDATSYNVYVNCQSTPANCWGSGTLTPGTFLKDLNLGGFIRLANEYTKSDALGHFPVKEMKTTATFAKNTNGVPTATRPNIFAILADAVHTTGVSGLRAIYHVFLPQGTDMCQSSTVCYSPDNRATWVFCAFHGAVNFAQASGPPLHVLFSVEPYQALSGCQFFGQTPHGVIDATASTLSHELIETMTDPDLNAWSNALFGFEIADICYAFATNQLLNGHNYFLQSEYSNRQHNCTNQAV